MRRIPGVAGLVLALSAAALLQACVTGEGVSFTAQGGGNSSFNDSGNDSGDETTTDVAGGTAGGSGSGLLASSGNALLPGGVILAQGPGGLADGSRFLTQPNGGSVIVGVTAGLELNQGQLPNASFGVTGDLAGSPLTAPLGGLANQATGGAAGNLLGAGANLASTGANGVSINGQTVNSVISGVVSPSGQPLSGIGGGAPSVLGTVSNVGGSIPAVAPTLVNTVSGATTVAGGVIGSVASTMTTPALAGTPATPTGLGGLTNLLRR